MIKSKNASWIHNITKTPTLEENTDYDKLMREHVKVKNNKLFLKNYYKNKDGFLEKNNSRTKKTVKSLLN
jgi:hypothetical protein